MSTRCSPRASWRPSERRSSCRCTWRSKPSVAWRRSGSAGARPSPLAYLARKVLTVLFGLYACAVYRDEFGRLVPTLWVLLVLLAPVASVAAWETARKIRIPEDETDYGTYSKLLGWRLAALLPAGFIAAGVACLAPVAVAARLDWRYVAALVSGAAIAIGACLRFRLAPTRARADLRRYVEGFGVVANGGLVVALAAQHGVVLS